MTKYIEEEIIKMVRAIFPQSSQVLNNSLTHLLFDLNTANVDSTELNKIKGKFQVVVCYNYSGLSTTVGLRFTVN